MSPPATCFRPWSARWPPLDVVRGTREPISQACVWLRPVLRLHLILRPGDGTSGSRPSEVCSILSLSSFSFCRHKFSSSEVVRPRASGLSEGRYFAVISARTAASSFAKRNSVTVLGVGRRQTPWNQARDRRPRAQARRGAAPDVGRCDGIPLCEGGSCCAGADHSEIAPVTEA